MKGLNIDLGKINDIERAAIDGNAVIVEDNQGNRFIGLLSRSNNILITLDTDEEEIYINDCDDFKIGGSDYGDNYTIVAEVEVDIKVKRFIKGC